MGPAAHSSPGLRLIHTQPLHSQVSARLSRGRREYVCRLNVASPQAAGNGPSTSGRGSCSSLPSSVTTTAYLPSGIVPHSSLQRAHVAIPPGDIEQEASHIIASLRPSVLGLTDLLQGASEVRLSGEPLPSGVVDQSEELTPIQAMNRRIKGCQSLAQLDDLIKYQSQHFEPASTSYCIHFLARQYRSNYSQYDHSEESAAKLHKDAQQTFLQPMLKTLTRRILKQVSSFDSRDVAVSLWSYAQLRYHDQEVFTAICDAAVRLSLVLKPIDCANIMTAFARFSHYDRPLLDVVMKNMLYSLSDAKPFEVSTVMYGFARLGIPPTTVFMEAVVDHITWNMHTYGTQELSNTLWALAKMHYRPSQTFLQAVEAVTCKRLPQLSMKDISQTVWAMGKVRYKAAALLDALPEYVVPRMHELNTTEMSNLLHGYTHARHYHAGMLDAIADAVTMKPTELSHQDLTVVLWALGIFEHRPANPNCLPVLSQVVHQRLWFLPPRSLSGAVKGLGTLGWLNQNLLRDLNVVVAHKIDKFRPDDLAHLLYGLAMLQCNDMAIFYAAVRQAVSMIEDPSHRHHGFAVQQLGSIVQSCQRVGHTPWNLIEAAEAAGLNVAHLRPSSSSSSGSPSTSASGSSNSPSASATHSKRLRSKQVQGYMLGGVRERKFVAKLQASVVATRQQSSDDASTSVASSSHDSHGEAHAAHSKSNGHVNGNGAQHAKQHGQNGHTKAGQHTGPVGSIVLPSQADSVQAHLQQHTAHQPLLDDQVAWGMHGPSVHIQPGHGGEGLVVHGVSLPESSRADLQVGLPLAGVASHRPVGATAFRGPCTV